MPSEAEAATSDLQAATARFDGRWKLLILFQLFGGRVRRFTELERALKGISQKVLTQQLRQLERDGLVVRTVHPEVPPRVDYALTDWGQALCPSLDSLLHWERASPQHVR